MLSLNKLTWLFAGLAIILIVLIALSMQWIALHDKQNLQLIEQQNRLKSTAQDLLLALTERETGQRGYLLTLSPAFLQPYEDNEQTIKDIMQRLKPLIDPLDWQSINEKIQQRKAYFETTLNLVNRGGADAQQQAIALVSKGTGLQYMQDFRQQLLVIIERSDAQLDQLRKANFTLQSTLYTVTWIDLLLMSLIVILPLAYWRQFILRPLHNLLKQIKSPTDGVQQPWSSDNRVASEIQQISIELLDTISTKNREMANINHNLEDLISQQTEELQHERDAAIEANQAKSQFVANVSHELRTPLHAIKSFSSLIGKKLNDPALIRFNNNIQVSVARLTRVVNDLLDLAKFDTGKHTMHISRHAISEPLNAAINELSTLLDEKAIKVTIEQQHEYFADFDPERLQQVFINLIGNAVKYGHSGHQIDIEVTSFQPQANINRDQLLRVCVRDYGIGVPQTELQSIFDNFSQSSRTYEGTGGTGLGLAICKNIIEAHSGFIWAESHSAEVPEGARFCFTLPKKQIKAHKSSITDKSVLHGKRILFVEDNEMLRNMAAEHFAKVGAKVSMAEDGENALAIASNNNFDCVITDIIMPNMSGDLLIRKLRESGFDKTIIALTVATQEPEVDDILAAGADYIMAKPLNMAKLSKLINS